MQALLAAHPSSEADMLLRARDEDGYTALHRAAYNNRVAALRFLLDAGVDVHARTIEGWTPLHSAAYWGQAPAAGLLLQAGADINALTHGAQTPLHLAAAQVSSAGNRPLRRPCSIPPPLVGVVSDRAVPPYGSASQTLSSSC